MVLGVEEVELQLRKLCQRRGAIGARSIHLASLAAHEETLRHGCQFLLLREAAAGVSPFVRRAAQEAVVVHADPIYLAREGGG